MAPSNDQQLREDIAEIKARTQEIPKIWKAIERVFETLHGKNGLVTEVALLKRDSARNQKHRWDTAKILLSAGLAAGSAVAMAKFFGG